MNTNEKIKIFVIAGQTSGFGGVETVVKKFCQLLSQDSEFEYRLLICGKPKSKMSLTWLKDLDYLNLAKSISMRGLVKFFSKYQLSKLVIKEKPSAIISYDAFGVEITRKVIDSLSPHCYKPKLIAWPHFSFETFSHKNKKRFLSADYHFAICDEIKKQIQNYSVDKSSIFTIYNPVQVQESVIPKSDDNINLLYIGRVQYKDQKNLQELFNGLSLIKGNYVLNIIGSNGNEVIELKNLAQKLKINSNIIWHGWQENPWEYVKKQIKTVNALVMTSTFEGFGMVIVEALSYGIYCISSDCKTGPSEIIQNNVNGHLYPLGDVFSLAKQLQNIIDNKNLPDQQQIKESIDYCYEKNYIERIKSILKQVKAKI